MPASTQDSTPGVLSQLTTGLSSATTVSADSLSTMQSVWSGDTGSASLGAAINAMGIVIQLCGVILSGAGFAYATGLSLYALHVAGVPATDDTYRKGVAFLLGSQYQDGSWFVRTHSFPTQRYFESGFPFGRHQWISAAGTSWASLAIAQTLPDTPR